MINILKKTGIAWITVITLLLSGCSNGTTPAADDAWVYENIEFDMPEVREPAIPENTVNLADLGGIPDGFTLNTDIFAKAIDQMAAQGGGKVVVPAGIWLTGPIVLQSNIELHLKAGALIRFSEDFDLYPLIPTYFEGLSTYRCQSPLSGKDLKNIAITGRGVIDGNGQAWRPVKKGKMTENQWENLVRSGGVLSDDGQIWFPSARSAKGYRLSKGSNIPPLVLQKDFMEIKDFLRPVMVSLINCQKVLLDGPTFQNSPAWNIHPLMCEDVTIRNLTVRNPWYSQNGDGLDLESCKNAVIYNNNFDVGDDAMCFKSGKDQEGRDRGMPTENVIVKNNVVYHGHGGFVIGSEMSGGVRNIHVSDCTFMGTNIGIRFKSNRGRGGVVENIYISNINMTDIPTEPIRFNMFYGGKAPVLDDGSSSLSLVENEPEAVAVNESTPVFRNIHVKNIVAGGFGNAALFMGLPELKLENVTLENAILRAPKGFTIVDAEGIQLKNVQVIQEIGPALTLFNSSHIELTDFDFNDAMDQPGIAVSGKTTGDIQLKQTDFSAPDTQIKLVNGAKASAISWD
ncbi:glycoside hydrolase family 28 protein [Geofilum rubicundum]|uniref:Polygalacturonase n=1 Tax=Geofilum rubicundum JCM 15548 TaxID=1236989 RepID=A0A0E9M120_9BACT|nr:glycoside hydrolase family 28 protein [Geofilum rubicundum]GAO31194.1 polygalacturonase [Geofilum rubicundum JCM 15548]